MRIQRRSSRLSFRRQPQRSGCFSWTFLLGMLVGAATMSWQWMGQRLQFASPSDTQNPFTQAMRAFERGDLDTTVEQARAAYDANPDDENALLLLVRALIYRSYADYNTAADRELALDITGEALSRDNQSSRRLAIHAYVLQANGQPAEAARLADEALRLDGQNTLARVAKALAYAAVGSFEVALRESQLAVQQGDWIVESQRAVAISYSDLGDYRRAIQAIEIAISHHRYLTPLYYERALYAMQLGNADDATSAYYQVLTYDPDNVKARMRLCELSSLLRERDAAIRHCGEVTQRAPEWANGWHQLGMEYFMQGDFAAAQRALNQCSTLQVMQNVPPGEREFECWYVQGQAAEILGDCPSLLALYTEFRLMAQDPAVRETWLYPPEGPASCPVVPATKPA